LIVRSFQFETIFLFSILQESLIANCETTFLSLFILLTGKLKTENVADSFKMSFNCFQIRSWPLNIFICVCINVFSFLFFSFLFFCRWIDFDEGFSFVVYFCSEACNAQNAN